MRRHVVDVLLQHISRWDLGARWEEVAQRDLAIGDRTIDAWSHVLEFSVLSFTDVALSQAHELVSHGSGSREVGKPRINVNVIRVG